MAVDNDTVDEFYSAAISAGARDNISPRVRVEYYAGYYAADVFDPDGYSFIRVKSSTKASEEPHIGKMITRRLGNKNRLRSSDRSSGHHRVQILESHIEQLLSMGMACRMSGMLAGTTGLEPATSAVTVQRLFVTY